MPPDKKKRIVAIIGSFRQHNDQVQQVCRLLRAEGHEVSSPQGSEIIENGVSFVRFTSDDTCASDPAIQSLALHRILRSELVFVVAPNGYVGNTTCYEIGRIVQSGTPIYFSELPKDLPILVPPSHVLEVAKLASSIADPAWLPLALYDGEQGDLADLENALLRRQFRND